MNYTGVCNIVLLKNKGNLECMFVVNAMYAVILFNDFTAIDIML